MSFGEMTKRITLIRRSIQIDDEGFSVQIEEPVAHTRAYREGRHGTERWANRAAFSEATDLFRFRKSPGIEITTTLQILCDGHHFDIISVEDVRGKGMYIEVLAKVVEPDGKGNL